MKQRNAAAQRKTEQPLWSTIGNAGNDQLAAAADCAAAMFKGFEVMRKVQERAAHETAGRHAEAAERLRNGCSPSDIAEIQTSLIKSNLEGSTQYWQQLAATSMEMQMRMLAAWNRTVDAEAMLQSLSTLSGKPH